jgi:hypothetical protein
VLHLGRLKSLNAQHPLGVLVTDLGSVYQGGNMSLLLVGLRPNERSKDSDAPAAGSSRRCSISYDPLSMVEAALFALF